MERDSPNANRTPATPDEPDERPKLVGVVLCGGAGKRMGRDKAVLEIDGELLVDRVARRLHDAGAERVLLATGTPGRLGPRPDQIPDDPAYGSYAGPLAGIVAALEAATSINADRLLVAAVDLPNASPALFRWLVDQWQPGDTALVPLDPTGRPQPLHT